MTVRDISHHLARTLGTGLSHGAISEITDAVFDEAEAGQTRPQDEIYSIVCLDALVVKVRDDHAVRNTTAHIAVGVDLDGVRHVLGVWVQATEGAKFWAGVGAELRNRGIAGRVDRVLRRPHRIPLGHRGDLVAGDREELHGPPDPRGDAVRVLHRPQKDRRRTEPIYTAPTVEAARLELDAFAASDLGNRYPAAVMT